MEVLLYRTAYVHWRWAQVDQVKTRSVVGLCGFHDVSSEQVGGYMVYLFWYCVIYIALWWQMPTTVRYRQLSRVNIVHTRQASRVILGSWGLTKPQGAIRTARTSWLLRSIPKNVNIFISVAMKCLSHFVYPGNPFTLKDPFTLRDPFILRDSFTPGNSFTLLPSHQTPLIITLQEIRYIWLLKFWSGYTSSASRESRFRHIEHHKISFETRSRWR